MPREITNADAFVQRFFEEVESDWVRVKEGMLVEVTAPEDVYFIKDDFGPGSTASIVGELGWQALSGAASYAASSLGRPGIVRVSSSSTINTYQYIRLANTSAGNILPAEDFDMRWIFMLNQVDANTSLRIGWGADSSANPPNNGMYLERLAADANFFFGTRASSSQTRVDTGVPANTDWHKLRIRRVSDTQIGFMLDDLSESVFTATIPTVALSPFCGIHTAEAVAKTVDVDFFSLRIDGLSR
jgi:hypothetical protein